MNAWGQSFGAAWGGSWGGGAPPPPILFDPGPGIRRKQHRQHLDARDHEFLAILPAIMRVIEEED